MGYREIALAGVRTRLLEAGPATATSAVVLLHGSPGTGADWASWMAHLGAKDIRAVAFDLPGYGHAEDVWARPQTADVIADYLDAAFQELGIERVHLVAHDLAGVVGLHWATRRPRDLRSATLLNTGALLGYRHHVIARLSRASGGEDFWAAMDRDYFAAAIQAGQTEPLPKDFTDRLYDDLDRETRCTIIRLYRSTSGAEVRRLARRQARLLSRQETRPVLVIWGANDPYLSVRMAERQREAFPAAEIEIFESASHWTYIDHPARTRRQVLPFLRQAVLGQHSRAN